MEKSIVHKFYRFWILLMLSGLMGGIARSETFHLSDGQTLTGEATSMDERGFIVKQADGTFSDRVPWSKLPQTDLKELQQNPKAATFVEPFIELTQEDKMKRTEIDLKEVPRLARPPSHSIIAAFFTSGLGLFTLLMLYAANLYAAYEISIFRAKPAGLVCGVSAVIPLVGPIIFISMAGPQVTKRQDPTWNTPADQQVDKSIAAAVAAEQGAGAVNPAEVTVEAIAQAPAAALPPTKTYPRGQYTFNRRFFETQLPGFFAAVRSEADKDMVLTFKSSRGTHIAQRISRITGNELHLQVQKGHVSEDISVPFVEIQEVQLKHKDA